MHYLSHFKLKIAFKMAYSDKTYFLTKIKESELYNLCKDSSGTPQMTYLDGAIATADEFIDSYLAKRIKTLPLNPVPQMVKQCSYFVAMYYLHERIQYQDIPQRIKDNYDVAVNWLKAVADGGVTLPIEETDVDTGVWFESSPFRF